MENENDFVLSDDAIAEQGKVADVGDSLRANVAEALGLADDDEYKEILDKAVEREQGLRKGYGELLGKYTPMKKAYKELIGNSDQGKKSNDPTPPATADSKTLRDMFNEEYLEDLEYTDDIKNAIREWSGFKNVSAKSASKAPHIVNMISEWQKEQKTKEAASNGNGQRGTTPNEVGADGKAEMPDKFTDPKYMLTEKGRKEYGEWVEKNRKG